MTRICEKFVEELSLTSGKVSAELREHLAICPECKEAFAAINQLKKQRKPISGKEAAAIACIRKAVHADSVGAVSSSNAVSEPVKTGMLRYFIMVVLAGSFVVSFLLNQSISQKEPVKPLPDVSAPLLMPQGSENTSEEVGAQGNASSSSILSASGSVDASCQEEDAAEADSAQTIMVSPDQEEISPK